MNAKDFDQALARMPRRRDQLLPALHAAQSILGWLPEQAIEAVGRHVFVPLSEVYGIVTSYSDLRLTPPAPDRVEVCAGLSCRLAGADGVIATLAADGRHHVERVPCRFLCAVAPVAESRGSYHARLAANGPPRTWTFPQQGLAVTGRTFPTVNDVEREPTLAHRRSSAQSLVRHAAGTLRILMGDGVCARAAGGEGFGAALRADERLRGLLPVSLVYVGCDGNCDTQPVAAVHRPDGMEQRFERVTEADVDAVVAAAQGVADSRSTVPSPRASYPGQTRRVLRNCGLIDPERFEEALAAGAYTGLERALALSPEEVVELVRASGLRGRGGAYFPVATKWESARTFPAPRYLVVNAEEGEPGVFKDRHLMEGDPHALVEGMLIAAYAIGAEKAFIYINGQAELSARRVERAVQDARAAGLVGKDIFGSGFSCEIEIYRGAGGYVCGEESVILNSIEGERAVPRLRPPFPTEAGLWGRPTVINNVETLVNLPLIVTEGVDWFRAVGTEAFPGTKLMSLSGALQRPGLVEVSMGTTIRQILAQAGGGAPAGHTITFAVVGGPSGGLMPDSMFDTPIQAGMLHPSGPVLGAGGIVALDERTPPGFALRELTAYNKEESCGKCTPCREGTARALALLDRAGAEPLSAEDREELLYLSDLLQTASLCGLGQMAPGPIRSALTLFDLTP